MIAGFTIPGVSAGKSAQTGLLFLNKLSCRKLPALNLRAHLEFLYNGGLDPDSADPYSLRRRRSLAGAVMTLAPIGFVMIFLNYLYEANHDNPMIALGMGMLFVSVYVQAYFNKEGLAAHFCIGAMWTMLTFLIWDRGLVSTPILWFLPLPALAVLLHTRKAGVIWCVVGTATLAAMATLENFGVITSDRIYSDIANQHMVARASEIFALEGSIIMIILTGAALWFRTMNLSAENKLSETVHSLRNEVHTRALAEEEARHSEQTKSAFFAAMGHELRTPLNGVIGATRLLRNTQSEPERDELTDVIMQSGETLLELINNVMDLSSLESGKLELERLPINIEELVNQTLAPLAFQAQSRGLSLDSAVSPELPEKVYGDPTRLRQILINLVGNAIKFTEQGAVTVAVDECCGSLRITVKDTGIGIAPEAQAKLFEPYVQADVDTTRKYGGSGLGLSIVKRLVSAMGGQIKLESEPGVGSTFKLYLPLEGAGQEVSAASERNSELPRLKALVVDDNAVNRMVLSRLLERDQHEVVEVANGREAIDYIGANTLDVVLMDIQMPEMDGFTAARKIRKLKGEKSKLPIIAITANTSKEEQEKALNSGMNGFVGKPFRYDELLHELQVTLHPGPANRSATPH